jgi:hypothetical protein
MTLNVRHDQVSLFYLESDLAEKWRRRGAVPHFAILTSKWGKAGEILLRKSSMLKR